MCSRSRSAAARLSPATPRAFASSAHLGRREPGQADPPVRWSPPMVDAQLPPAGPARPADRLPGRAPGPLEASGGEEAGPGPRGCRTSADRSTTSTAGRSSTAWKVRRTAARARHPAGTVRRRRRWRASTSTADQAHRFGRRGAADELVDRPGEVAGDLGLVAARRRRWRPEVGRRSAQGADFQGRRRPRPAPGGVAGPGVGRRERSASCWRSDRRTAGSRRSRLNRRTTGESYEVDLGTRKGHPHHRPCN